jgi:hypothetical protein
MASPCYSYTTPLLLLSLLYKAILYAYNQLLDPVHADKIIPLLCKK